MTKLKMKIAHVVKKSYLSCVEFMNPPCKQQ